jgi:diaminopimelate decarboxylase
MRGFPALRATPIRASSVASFSYPPKKSVLHAEGVSLIALAEKYGTPLYVYSAGQILDRYQLFSRAFAARPHLLCYSVKANSNLSILKLLARRGAGFDIVSGGELVRVLRVSKKAARRVVFSGVGKTAEEMDLALKAEILLFNVESQAEVALLAERAQKLGKRARVALRVNPDVFAETHPYISTGLREHKFGIDICAARELYQQIKRFASLQPVGVSVHIGSQIRNAAPFGAAMERVAQLIRELETDGIRIGFVDAGGGLGIEYRRESSSDRQSFDPVSEVGSYAAAIDRALEGMNVRLLLEPGRFIVAQAGALVARVLYIKKNGEKTFVVTDAGMNDLIRPALYQAHHEILPVTRGLDDESQSRTPRSETIDVVGPVCETGDFFARDREMPPLAQGDLLAILDAGAYGMSLSSNYNSRPRPAEVLVSGKKARLIRRRETMRDLLGPESGLF